MFTPDVLAVIREAYESDFQRWFADADVLPPGVLDDDYYPDPVLAEIRAQAERSAARG
jgi:hypothetical protein